MLTDNDFKILYEDYKERLVTIATLYVRDRMAAEDIVADSFVRLYYALPTLSSDVKIAPYLVTIVKNQCLNHLKQIQTHQRVEGEMERRHERILHASILSLSALDPDQLFAEEVRRLVQETIAGMPELTRKVFFQSRQCGSTYQEIADTLGISSRRVHTEMQRALSILRKALKDYLPSWLVILYLNNLFK